MAISAASPCTRQQRQNTDRPSSDLCHDAPQSRLSRNRRAYAPPAHERHGYRQSLHTH